MFPFHLSALLDRKKLVSGPYQNTYLKPAHAAKDIKPVSSSHPFLSHLA